MHAPRTKYLNVIPHILRYLKTSPDLGLFFTATHQSKLSCFTDANHARSRTDRRSTSSFCTFYGDHVVSWKSKKIDIALIIHWQAVIVKYLHTSLMGSVEYKN
ncbi:hypothetical protein CsSME_00045987 [Camellia sinensis var. sinensis]